MSATPKQQQIVGVEELLRSLPPIGECGCEILFQEEERGSGDGWNGEAFEFCARLSRTFQSFEGAILCAAAGWISVHSVG